MTVGSSTTCCTICVLGYIWPLLIHYVEITVNICACFFSKVWLWMQYFYLYQRSFNCNFILVLYTNYMPSICEIYLSGYKNAVDHCYMQCFLYIVFLFLSINICNKLCLSIFLDTGNMWFCSFTCNFDVYFWF